MSELRDGFGRVVQVGGKAIAIFRSGDDLYAIDNACPHVQGPLGEGELHGTMVACPWHNWRFDVSTGEWDKNPEVRVACYPVRVSGDDVYLEV